MRGKIKKEKKKSESETYVRLERDDPTATFLLDAVHSRDVKLSILRDSVILLYSERFRDILREFHSER